MRVASTLDARVCQKEMIKIDKAKNVHRAVRVDFGPEIIANELVHRAVRADFGAKVIAHELVHRALRADFGAEIIAN